MRDIEVKLRLGMTRNAIAPAAQNEIIQSITSFALYGFPESHAASFALLAYASAWLKTHYLAAFTAALLNNQPMGFYHASTVVKDAQRHGLKFKPIDVLKSDWLCTLEEVVGHGSWVAGKPSGPRPATVDPRPEFAVRLGLRYVKGLREEAARALVERRKLRPFASIDELARRVPELSKSELQTLAEVGALNSVSSFEFPVSSKQPANLKLETRNSKLHRRDALWQVERATRPAGPLLEELPEQQPESPLQRMTAEERLVADFRSTSMTVGPHPMAYRRSEMHRLGVRPANELEKVPNGQRVRAAGCVIARQRPGTAHGFVFLSLEDETGIANAIITPDLFEQNRVLLVSEKFLLVEGVLQNLDHVVSVKAERVLPLRISQAQTRSHDFH